MGIFEQYPAAFLAAVVLVSCAAGWISARLAISRPADYNDPWYQRLFHRLPRD